MSAALDLSNAWVKEAVRLYFQPLMWARAAIRELAALVVLIAVAPASAAVAIWAAVKSPRWYRRHRRYTPRQELEWQAEQLLRLLQGWQRRTGMSERLRAQSIELMRARVALQYMQAQTTGERAEVLRKQKATAALERALAQLSQLGMRVSVTRDYDGSTVVRVDDVARHETVHAHTVPRASRVP